MKVLWELKKDRIWGEIRSVALKFIFTMTHSMKYGL